MPGTTAALRAANKAARHHLDASKPVSFNAELYAVCTANSARAYPVHLLTMAAHFAFRDHSVRIIVIQPRGRDPGRSEATFWVSGIGCNPQAGCRRTRGASERTPSGCPLPRGSPGRRCVAPGGIVRRHRRGMPRTSAVLRTGLAGCDSGARLADTGRCVTAPSVSRGLETSAVLQIRVRRWPGANGGEPLGRCPGTRIFVNRLPSTMLRAWNSSAGGECPRSCLCFRWGLPDCLSWSGERVCLAFRAVAPDAEVGHDGNTPVSRETPEAVCASDGPRQVVSRPEERTLLEPTETPRD
jgi:hypothetical protein